MNKFLRILGFLWLLPITIPVWCFYVLPLWACRQITFRGMHSFLIAKFQVDNKDSWYMSFWKDWAGWSGPCVIIYKDPPTEEDDRWIEKTLTHEEQHCDDQFLFGPFFYPAYGAASAYIWFFKPDKHAYLDNLFEKVARKAAGQPVDIPRDQWPHGPNDRNPWW